MLVRERPPLRLGIAATTPSGRQYRWAPDEPKAQNVPQNLRFGDTIPGGFESLDCKLMRKPATDYSDLVELSTLQVVGAGGDIAGEYRLERTPRQSGNELNVSPSAVGWQAHLDDNKAVREIYVDVDLSHWVAASTQRKLNEAGTYSIQDASTTPDATTGQPSLACLFSGAWGAAPGLPLAEGWYDPGAAIRIGQIYYAWKLSPNGNLGADTHAIWGVNASTDDVATATDSSGNLRAAGPGTGTLTATGGKRFGFVNVFYNAAGGAEGAAYGVYWTCLAVYGDHGLTLYGTADATHAQGVLASDVVAHAVGKHCQAITATSIDPTSFVIPQLAFIDSTTVSEIVKQACRFELNDWAVWEGPTFHLHPRGSYGRKWRARVGPAKLQETGPQVDRMWNQISVAFSDVSGVTRTVGPPGSGADTEDASLVDPDPENPANQRGIVRSDLLTMGTSTAEAAIKVGSTFLQQAKLLDTSGQAAIVGHVLDDRGVMHPYWRVRAGDSITFVDAHDPVERRIVKTDKDDSTKTCQVDLDSPAEGLTALLERLSASIVQLGFS